MRPGGPPRPSGRLGCLIAAILALGAAALMARPLMESYAAWLEVEDPEARSDLAVVLDGGEGERLWKGIDLWERRLCQRLLITGDEAPILPVYAGGPGITQAQAKREIAVRRGVPADSIEVLLGPTSTYEEAQAVREWCVRRAIGSVTVVTSPYHTRRARAVFRHAFRDTDIRIAIAHASWELAGCSPRRWWTREKDLIAVFDETVKSFYYAVHFKIFPF